MPKHDPAAVTAHARRVVEARLHEDTFSAAVLADALCVSRDYLSRCLRQEAGLNARALIRTRRLDRARSLLQSGEAECVAHAAYAVGYDSPAAFSRAYSRHWGAPPSDDLPASR
jgi:AraC-like DNA-binding protein